MFAGPQKDKAILLSVPLVWETISPYLCMACSLHPALLASKTFLIPNHCPLTLVILHVHLYFLEPIRFIFYGYPKCKICEREGLVSVVTFLGPRIKSGKTCISHVDK